MLSNGQRSSGWPRYQLTNLSQISIFFFFFLNTSRDTDATLMSIMHPSLAEEEEEEEVEEEVEQEQGVTPREGQRR